MVKLWIARHEYSLVISPVPVEWDFDSDGWDGEFMEINSKYFPEVTESNSPKPYQLVLDKRIQWI